MRIAALPQLDEHTTVINAEPEEVWRALGEAVDRAFGRLAGYPKLVGAKPCTASGPRPFAEGSTLPGFEVIAADPNRELILRGTHHYSTYAVLFHLERTGPRQSRLRVESRASFPGLIGKFYRRIVVGTGGHGLVVRHLLNDIRRRSELHERR